MCIVNNARLTTAKENAEKDDSKFRVVHHKEGSLVNISRPITKKGETSRLLYQAIGPFKVLGHSSPPNSDGSYNSYRCEHLGTGRVSSFNVRDIIPYISVEAYEQEKARASQAELNEEEVEKEEYKKDPDFDPKEGDFLLFPNFGDVPYHLVQVTGRPFKDAVTFSYFGVSKQNKKRLVGFQQVWNHEDASKPEIQQNAPVKLKGYKIVDHEVLLSEFCQEVIVPVEYGPPTNRKFKLKYSDVQEVLKYRPDT